MPVIAGCPVNGIAAAFLGTVVGNGGELRFLPDGRSVLSFSVLVYDSKKTPETPAEFVRVSCWEALADSLETALTKGTEVYCEGRLKVASYTTKEGEQRTGVNCSAWKVDVLGKIGRSAPKRREAARPAQLRQDRAPWEESA